MVSIGATAWPTRATGSRRQAEIPEMEADEDHRLAGAEGIRDDVQASPGIRASTSRACSDGARATSR